MAELNPTADTTRFKSYDDQDKKDLAYSMQKKEVQALLNTSKNRRYKDESISGDWVPEQD